MAHHVNFMMDEELFRAIREHAEGRNITFSQALRDLLRKVMDLVGSEQEAGWREGFKAGTGDVLRALAEYLDKVKKLHSNI